MQQLPRHGQTIVRIGDTVFVATEPGVALGVSDPSQEVPRGNIPGVSSINKYGRSTNVDNGIETDVWDRANAVDDQDVWIAPTIARVHQIVSSSASDDGSPAGVGARTIEILGLRSWDTKEVSEIITLNGVTDVPTVNSYVIIHRMRVLTKGATSVNVGVITATADVDATVTAQINAGIGQTRMAIYGIPSSQKAYMPSYYASVIKNAASVRIMIDLMYNPEPDAELTNFLNAHTFGLDSDGSGDIQHRFTPYREFVGPTILKVRGNSSANDSDVSAGFDLILVDN